MIFEEGIDNFAVVLRGQSIEKIDRVYKNYSSCLFVSDLDNEIDKLGKYLVNKNGVQLVNRGITCPWRKENYEKMKVKDVIFPRVKGAREKIKGGDIKTKKLKSLYKNLNLRIHYLPSFVMKYAPFFGKDFKFVNTGVLGIVYALTVVRPKHLWIIGLDFYQTDYIVKRKGFSLVKRQERMKEYDVANVLIKKFIEPRKDVQFHIVTYYDGFPKLDNLELL